MMLLSVVIVNFNGAQIIKKCLDCVFDESYPFKFEVVLIDNASSDDSVKVLDPYFSKIVFIQKML